MCWSGRQGGSGKGSRTYTTMNEKFSHIIQKFEMLGALARIRELPPGGVSRSFMLDVFSTRQGERFDVSVAAEDLELHVLDVQPADRHLLLLAVEPGEKPSRPEKRKFLCGHDERHWFVAGVPERVTSVREAKEALKPALVRATEERLGVRARDRRRRRNAASVRQGEWFFVPAPELVPDERFVLRHEPISRGRGKPHMVERLYRRGGTTVHTCRQYPIGLPPAAFADLLRRQPEKKNLGWQIRTRDPEAFACGRVRHPDHRTVVLAGWHRILLSSEVRSEAVAFLD